MSKFQMFKVKSYFQISFFIHFFDVQSGRCVDLKISNDGYDKFWYNLPTWGCADCTAPVIKKPKAVGHGGGVVPMNAGSGDSTYMTH